MSEQDPQWSTGAVSAIVAAATGVGTAVGMALKFLMDLRKQSWTEQKEAAAPYVEELRKMLDDLKEHHAECMRNNAEMREEIGRLRERVRNLEGEVEDLHQRLSRRGLFGDEKSE